MTGRAGARPGDPEMVAEPEAGPGPALGRVRQVPLPPHARANSTLARVDYADAFLLETPAAGARTGEQWARAMLEDAPRRTRRALAKGWLGLGLRTGPARSGRFVLGWEIQRRTADLALLGVSGRLGLSAELLFEPQPHALLFATFAQLDNPVARAAWGWIAPRHRRIVGQLLEQAGRRARDAGRQPP